MNVEQTVPLIYVSDVDASQRFYCDRLGFSVQDSWAPDEKLAWCWLTREGAALMLQQGENDDLPMRGAAIYFLCDDANAIYHDLRARGVDVAPPSQAFYGMNQLFVRDPDGSSLCFESRIAQS